jgi:hypothetical protein
VNKIIKSGKTIIVLISLLFGALLSGCDQEALFWDIAHEYPPIEPDIDGRPTKIVEILDSSDPPKAKTLFAGNNTGHVWRYDPAGDHFWREITGPGFTVRDLAVADNQLFALSGDNGGISRWDDDVGEWKSPILSSSNFEKLFGAGSHLFGVAQTGSLEGEYSYKSAYTITCLDTSGNSVETIPDTGTLMGAVYDGTAYHLGTLGGGYYFGAIGGLAASRDTSKYGDTIVGLTVHKGNVFVIGPSTVYFPGSGRINPGYPLSGAIVGWTDGTDHLLLIGVQHSSGAFGYGYREIQIDGTTGAQDSGGFVVPGEGVPAKSNPEKRLSSVAIGSQYVSAIGEHAVGNFYVLKDMTQKADNGNSVYNAPARPVIFASTIKDGLWSYRARDGDPQWNGEDTTPYGL